MNLGRRLTNVLDAAYVGRLALVAGAYFASAKAGLEFAFANESVTSIWPPTGLALAAMVLWGYRVWPAVALGAFLANITTAGPLLSVLGIATGNTLEAVVGTYLLRRVDFRPSLDRVRDVIALVICAAALSTTVSATIGVASLSAADLVKSGETLSTWRVWWLGDAGGDLIVAPALMVLASRSFTSVRSWIRAEALFLLIGLIVVSAILFSIDEPLVFVLFPILFWIALRLRQPGTVVAGLIVSGIATWFTARGIGPFVGGSNDAELLRSQSFVGVATITALLAAALTTERRRLEERFRYLADHDPLTGLLNRRSFTQELQRWIAFNSRYGGRGAVLLMDIDYLKYVNDSLGHAVGDELIVRLGRLLRRRLRETDIVARWGGDELTVLLPRASEEDALRAAEALLEEVHTEGMIEVGDRTIEVTTSIGATTFGEGIDVDADQVLANADIAMYRAKEAGRDRIELFAEEPSAAPEAEDRQSRWLAETGDTTKRVRLASLRRLDTEAE